MDKENQQAVIISLIAQVYLSHTKLSCVEQLLQQIADKVDPDLLQSYQIDKNNALKTALSLAQMGFFDNLEEQNELVLQRIKELAPHLF